MAGEDFTWTPKFPVTPVTPVFNTLETQNESFKRQIQLLDSNTIETFELPFGDVAYSGETNCRVSLHDHFIDQNFKYTPFSWTSVPDYIASSPFNVRYEDYQEVPDVNGEVWNIKIILRKEN